jgi:hypothetical protein
MPSMLPASAESPVPENVLVTGLPRSGTTMTCWLLNSLRDVVALHEPIKFADFPDTQSVGSIVEEFIQTTRTQLLHEGTAPSHAMQGRIESNPVSSESDPDQPRRVIHNHQLVAFGKPNHNHFQLVIKHNAPFTALLEPLAQQYPLAVVIRNPVALLCSWQTVPLPIREGRLPMAERYDKDLRESLAGLSEPLHRQIAILDWCFDKYRSAQIHYKYEDLIRTGGRVLASLFPAAQGLNVELTSRNQNTLYPLHSCSTFARALLERSQAWRLFYSEAEILALAEPEPQPPL